MVDFYGFHVGKYTSPMDGMGYDSNQYVENNWLSGSFCWVGLLFQTFIIV